MRGWALAAGLFLASLAVGAAAQAREPALPPVASLTDGVWMKGDLHIHSRHSKDSSNNPVGKIIALAETVGMDYLLISDHDNHVDGDVAHHTWADPEYHSDKVLLLYGAEWTTHRGHGTAISARPYDHQKLYDVRDQRDVKIGAVKRALGIHLSANHPGGSDNFGFSYDLVDSIEVWNSAVWPKNANALEIWDDMLKSGRKLTGRGGSDSHHGYPDTPAQATPLSRQAPANNVGTPTTWVFATARTREAVVAALTNGRVSVSANPYAPRVEFEADLDGDGRMDMMMGDNTRASGKPVRFRVRLAGKTVPGAVYTVSVVRDGAKFGTFQATGGAETAVEFADTPATGSAQLLPRAGRGTAHALSAGSRLGGAERDHGGPFQPDLFQLRPDVLGSGQTATGFAAIFCSSASLGSRPSGVSSWTASGRFSASSLSSASRGMPVWSCR